MTICRNFRLLADTKTINASRWECVISNKKVYSLNIDMDTFLKCDPNNLYNHDISVGEIFENRGK